MTLNSGSARLLVKLVLACAVALALPTTAAAATPASVAVKSAGGEPATDLVFRIECGTMDPLDIAATGQIAYETVAGTATEGADYEKTTGTFNCTALPGGTGTDVPVKVLDDNVDEVAETVSLRIAAGEPGFAGTIPAAPADSAAGTIADDDKPVISVGVAQIIEGDSGTSNATVPIMIDQSPAQDVVLSYTTQDLSATSGSDYEAKSGEVTIPAGHSAANPVEIPVAIIGDTTAEGVEGFFFTATPKDASVAGPAAGAQGAVVIYDNDTVKFSLDENARVTEGNSGTVNAIFTVNLSQPALQEMQVAWRTENWTATLADYEGGQGIIKFAPGDTSQTFSVNVKGDLREETTEMFAVILTGPVGGEIAEGKDKALGIIDDDDKKGPKVVLEDPVTDRRNLSVLVTCPDTVTTGCKGSLVAKRKRLRFGKGSFDIPKAGTAEVNLKMSRKAYRRLKKRAIRVKFIARTTDGESRERKTKEKFRLKKAS